MWVDFKHLSKANIGYIPHALRVSAVSLKLILIGVAGIIHAFLPVIFLGIIINHLNFKVDNPISAKITAIIQNLITIVGSAHPLFSK